MSTTPDPAKVIADRVAKFLEDEDRSFAWLARQVGISESTLRLQLNRPDLLRFDTVVRLHRTIGSGLLRLEEAA